MPELPEVETVVRQLAQELPGRRIHRAQIHDPLLGKSPVEALGGRSIESVFRRGKLVVVQVGAAEKALAVLADVVERAEAAENDPSDQRSIRTTIIRTIK